MDAGRLIMSDTDRRGQILEVAEELFARKGYNEASMREIAERLDMKKPSLYHHFRNKEEIYNTLILDIYGQVLDELVGMLEQGETVEEKITLAIRRMIDLWAEHPNYPMIMAYEIISGSEIISSELLPKIWRPHLDEAIKAFETAREKEPRYRDVDIPLLIVIVFGIPIFYFFSNQIQSNLLSRDNLSPEMIERFKKELTALVLYGLQRPET
jgi:AcrR family transcriptional regulator